MCAVGEEILRWNLQWQGPPTARTRGRVLAARRGQPAVEAVIEIGGGEVMDVPGALLGLLRQPEPFETHRRADGIGPQQHFRT